MFKFTHRVVPVLVIDDASWALELGNCLVENGIPIIEVTLRTSASWSALEKMRDVKGLTLGVGSISNSAELIRANEIGVQFAVSAGLREDLVTTAADLNLPYFPGVSTPSEILQAIKLGLTKLKWFPAETLGGVKALNSISAPFPNLTFMPTGGINFDNARNYLALKNVVGVGGSWMFPLSAMKEKNLEIIASLIEEASTLD